MVSTRPHLPPPARCLFSQSDLLKLFSAHVCLPLPSKKQPLNISYQFSIKIKILNLAYGPSRLCCSPGLSWPTLLPTLWVSATLAFSRSSTHHALLHCRASAHTVFSDWCAFHHFPSPPPVKAQSRPQSRHSFLRKTFPD